MEQENLKYKLERAQMMADVAGQLADQRMRRIQFELQPLVEFWKKQYCDLVDRLIQKASNSPTQSISLKELYLMQNPNAHIG